MTPRARRRAIVLALIAPAVLGAGAQARGAERSQMAPILDDAKGERAASDYRAFLRRSCRGVRDGVAVDPAPFVKAGLHPDADLNQLCGPAAAIPTPLASGSLTAQGADEVLLEVPSGKDRAAGEHALAVMRDEGSTYQLRRYLLSGGHFEARARLLTSSGLDVLMLCERSGSMGLYPTRCGFLGQGYFRSATARRGGDVRAAGSGDKNDLDLVQVTACGSGASVSLGTITWRERHLQVELLVEHFTLEPGAPDEVAHGPYCSKKNTGSSDRFVIEYALSASGVRRLTPIPRQVEEVLAHD